MTTSRALRDFRLLCYSTELLRLSANLRTRAARSCYAGDVSLGGCSMQCFQLYAFLAYDDSRYPSVAEHLVPLVCTPILLHKQRLHGWV